VSDAISGPVTFAQHSAAPQCIDWDLSKRRAVLAHEGAHVAPPRFLCPDPASLNRAVFCSARLLVAAYRLAELAEIISDAQAIEVSRRQSSYAEISRSDAACPAGAGSLEMARGVRSTPRMSASGATAVP